MHDCENQPEKKENFEFQPNADITMHLNSTVIIKDKISHVKNFVPKSSHNTR
jgi:hypothetical protein